MFWLAVLCLLAVLAILRPRRFNGVKHLPAMPIVGSVLSPHYSPNGDKLYRRFPNERFVGYYEFSNPIILLRDPELMKAILVKDFDNFVNRKLHLDFDPVFGKTLLNLRDQQWRDMRATLSPAFTGSKLRQTLPLITEVIDNLIDVLKMKIQSTTGGHIDIAASDMVNRFTIDGIAACGFGLKLDSQTDRNNEFMCRVNQMIELNFWSYIKGGLALGIPKLMKILNLSMLSTESFDFFKMLVTKIIKEREENNIKNPDLIQLLMDMTKKGHWPEDTVVAQAALFLIGGYKSVANAVSFLLYELVANRDAQARLAQEILETDRKTGGRLDYDVVQNMTYLDMVICETLRKWPFVFSFARQCSNDYSLGKPNDKAEEEYVMRKGDYVLFQTYEMHRDPQYFPDPEKFDPERFSEENKKNIKPYTYLPFGAGPRNCIGARLAIYETKLLVYQLLKNFVLSPAPDTNIPAKIHKVFFTMEINEGNRIRFSTRNCIVNNT